MRAQFKENLRFLRNKQGLGQAKLAELVGLSKASISYWENGVQEPGMSALIKLAEFFKVSIDYLVGLEN